MLGIAAIAPLLGPGEQPEPVSVQSASPTESATASAAPTDDPARLMLALATAKPTAEPTPEPTARPTVAPTAAPTVAATPVATPAPTSPPVAPPAVGVAGYGAAADGGLGGRVATVTNLNDSGAGSLRAAIAGSGSRTVVFAVSGTIALKSDLVISDPFLTIDGSTAPGPVAVRGAAVKIVTHDVILRHLRLRPGDDVAQPAEVDALTINGLSGEAYNIVVDHVTMLWGPDIGGLAILGNVHDVTVQYSIMGEGLYLSRHPEAVTSQDGHSMAASIFQLDAGVQWPRRLTFHHNLFTTSDQRMPVVQGAECVDLVNNVIYNWGNKGLHGNPRSMNVVNNWFRSGPETTTKLIYQWQHHSANPNPYPNSVYLAGNTADGFTAANEAPSGVLRSSTACGGLSVSGDSAQVAYNTVVAAAGATLPVRDVVDQRVISNLTTRGGTFFNGSGSGGTTPYWPY
jgi:pectate lyase